MTNNSPINNWIRKIRKKQLNKKNRDKKDIISSWRSQLLLNNTLYDSLTLIIRTQGCRWARESGCSMCGYIYDANKSITQKQIYNQINNALESNNFENDFFIKIFTSGSFLDTREISNKNMKKIIKRLKEEKNFKGLSIETRPEFIDENKLRYLDSSLPNYIIGIGLETTNDEIRKECINKGYSLKDYKNSLNKIKKHNGYVKTYLLLKPPFLSEKTALEDCIKSIKEASEIGSDKISINPCNVQKATIVEELFRNQEYRPPWLWSLKEVFKKTHNVRADLVTDPIGAGQKRGPHNCGKCDKEVLDSLKNYSKTQQKNQLIDNGDCSCREEWRKTLEIEEESYNIIT